MLSDEDVKRLGSALASILKGRREELKLSKNLLAQQAGVSVQTIAFIESGTNSPSVATLARLCHALNTTPQKVLKGAEEASR